MKVVVSKSPDGVVYMTKDGHGEVFSGEVGSRTSKFGDCTLAAVNNGEAVRFSYVDYLDTANRDKPGQGVRHTTERTVPASFDFGPYVVNAR